MVHYQYRQLSKTRIIISGDDETTFIDYYYDLNGLRIKKEVITEYNDDRINEFEIIKYYYEGNRLITEYKDENKRLDFLYDNNGILYGFIENKTNIYYYVRDCMQNILGIIDSNNKIVVKYNYNLVFDTSKGEKCKKANGDVTFLHFLFLIKMLLIYFS